MWRCLARDPDYVALCHWNANVDNAWFWRDTDDVLHCGLMDWGCVSQMNVGMAIWGAMSGAETELWNNHLDDLLQLFVDEVHSYGGPKLDTDELRTQTTDVRRVHGRHVAARRARVDQLSFRRRTRASAEPIRGSRTTRVCARRCR